ncbi:MAG: hypothetical protein JXD22_11755 [Sedimentisphaerales bacterium]|nr:hypothetical protein [Sedimentisphaerales bacterium]
MGFSVLPLDTTNDSVIISAAYNELVDATNEFANIWGGPDAYTKIESPQVIDRSIFSSLKNAAKVRAYNYAYIAVDPPDNFTRVPWADICQELFGTSDWPVRSGNKQKIIKAEMNDIYEVICWSNNKWYKGAIAAGSGWGRLTTGYVYQPEFGEEPTIPPEWAYDTREAAADAYDAYIAEPYITTGGSPYDNYFYGGSSGTTFVWNNPYGPEKKYAVVTDVPGGRTKDEQTICRILTPNCADIASVVAEGVVGNYYGYSVEGPGIYEPNAHAWSAQLYFGTDTPPDNFEEFREYGVEWGIASGLGQPEANKATVLLSNEIPMNTFLFVRVAGRGQIYGDLDDVAWGNVTPWRTSFYVTDFWFQLRWEYS